MRWQRTTSGLRQISEDKLEASLSDATYWLQKLEIKRGEIAKET